MKMKIRKIMNERNFVWTGKMECERKKKAKGENKF